MIVEEMKFKMKVIPVTEERLYEIDKLKSIGVSTHDLDDIYGLYVDDKLIGFSQHLKIGYYLEVDNLHILKEFRYKGYGRDFVEYLRCEYKDKINFISGQSKPDAVGFWSSMEAKFEEEISEKEIASAELEGYCFPFTIRVKEETTRMTLV